MFVPITFSPKCAFTQFNIGSWYPALYSLVLPVTTATDIVYWIENANTN